MNLSLNKQTFLNSLNDNTALSKALANYLFREVIEDAHAKYKISEEDVKTMCENAVNRAEALIRIMDNGGSMQSIIGYSLYTKKWNPPDEEHVKRFYDFLSNADNEIKEVKKELRKH